MYRVLDDGIIHDPCTETWQPGHDQCTEGIELVPGGERSSRLSCFAYRSWMRRLGEQWVWIRTWRRWPSRRNRRCWRPLSGLSRQQTRGRPRSSWQTRRSQRYGVVEKVFAEASAAVVTELLSSLAGSTGAGLAAGWGSDWAALRPLAACAYEKVVAADMMSGVQCSRDVNWFTIDTSGGRVALLGISSPPGAIACSPLTHPSERRISPQFKQKSRYEVCVQNECLGPLFISEQNFWLRMKTWGLSLHECQPWPTGQISCPAYIWSTL